MSSIWLLVGQPKCIFINSLKKCSESLIYCAVYCETQPSMHCTPFHNFGAFHFSLYNRKYSVYHGLCGLYYLSCSVTESLGVKNRTNEARKHLQNTQWKDRTAMQSQWDPHSCNTLDTFAGITIHLLLNTKYVFWWALSWVPVDITTVNDPRTVVFGTQCKWSVLWDVKEVWCGTLKGITEKPHDI